MYTKSIAALAALAGLVSSAPTFSLPNGFPAPNASALARLQKSAGGTLPNTPLPTKLKANAIQDLQVIAVNEIFEVAYFNSLLHNVTRGQKGYDNLGGMTKEFTRAALHQIRAQEELHAIGANAILKSAGATTINPCEYMFPVDNFADAIATAALFTELVLGTLQSVQKDFALDGGQAAQGLVSLVGSIIGQEGEQTGAYRLIGKKVPSSSPFLTNSAGAFAFNAVAQMFIVPGSCGPEVAAIGIPSFEPLTPTTAAAPKNGTMSFETSATGVKAGSNYITYISGQNAPVVVPITSVATKGGMTTFKADFPFEAGFSKGLTIAALTKGKGPFTSATDASLSTLAGPGLIVVE